MKRLVIFLLSLAMLSLACNISTPATPPTNTSEPPVTLPPATNPPATQPPATQPPATNPPATQPPAPVTNVTCNELSLYLDASLASGYDCKTVPEQTEGMEVYPQYTELTFQGYPLADRFFTPHISVFPLQRFSELASDMVNTQVSDLQALVSGGPQGDHLPLLPGFNAAQEFHPQYKVQAFTSGTGIRFLTQYAQFTDPANNHELFYTFQGLTADGKNWISAILPISNPILPENGDNPPNGQTFEQFSNNFPAYVVDITNQLNSQTAASFTPTITALDALVASIKIQP